MLSKRRPYVKSYDSKNKSMYFLVEDGDLLKNIIPFRIKLALILKNLFTKPNLFSIKFFEY